MERKYLVSFGQYKGRSLEYIAENHINYLIWMYNEVTHLPDHIVAEIYRLICEYQGIEEEKYTGKKYKPFLN